MTGQVEGDCQGTVDRIKGKLLKGMLVNYLRVKVPLQNFDGILQLSHALHVLHIDRRGCHAQNVWLGALHKGL